MGNFTKLDRLKHKIDKALLRFEYSGWATPVYLVVGSLIVSVGIYLKLV